MIAPALAVLPATAPVRDYLSWSAINTYLQCPLRYRFRYVDQLPEEFLNSALIFGQAIHAALEAHFRAQLSSGDAPELETLLAAYHQHWSIVNPDQIRWGACDTRAALGLLAERMLSTFRESELAEPVGTIVSIEDEWRGPLAEGVPDLLARLDLVVAQDNALVITDFKTSRSRWSMPDVTSSAGQLLLYGELLRRQLDRPVRLQFAVLTKTRQPQLEVHPVAADPARIARQIAIIQRVWRSIQGAHFYPHPTAMNCTACPYQTACARWPGEITS